MKKFTFILTLLIAITITNAYAQIPNSGFENWPLSTNGWPVGNPIQSNDVYPPGVGNYSLKMMNNAGGTNFTDFGFCVTFPTPGSWLPSFPITGHPDYFTGYYKFTQVNGDTAVIAAVLYLNGDTVSSAFLRVTSSVPAWTSFNIPFTSYVSADSASAGFSAYNWYFGVTGMPTMHGNSELYIDNLSFDTLVSSVPEQPEQPNFSIYPNPASDLVNLTFENVNNEKLTLGIYNVTGELISVKEISQNHTKIEVGNLPNGIYSIEIRSNDWIAHQKLIIQR